jgi:5-methylcytosine-specific restriction endonuclease McrA
MEAKVKSFAIAALRRASYRWPGRYEALKASKIARNEYVCALCQKVFPRRMVQLDHKIAIVPLTGWQSFDSFIEGLYCSQDGYQTLCKPCHKGKTLTENATRRANVKRKTTGSKKQAKTRRNSK